MPHTLMTPRQVELVVSSVRKVFATGDIDNLTKQAYNVLYLCSGFIAHTDIHGFRATYENVNDLKANLARSYGANQWRNFHVGDRDYDYYMEKRDIYNRICGLFDDQGYKFNQGFW